MSQDEQPRPTHFFTVRVWLEKLADGQTEWRGKVQHVLTGERYYFRAWPTLIAHLVAMLPDEANNEANTEVNTKATKKIDR